MAAEVTVTVKGRGRDEPWLVFKGSVDECFQQIVQAFGFSSEQARGLTLAELTHNAQQDFCGLGVIAADLGGRAVPAASVPDGPVNVGADTPAEDVAPATAVPPEAEPAGDPLVEAIGRAASLDDIQRLWVRNQEAFSQEAVQAAVRRRREELGI